jgi:Lon protease-like protein
MRIFEQRYMDMAKVCLKESSSFGICLIVQRRRGRAAGRYGSLRTPEAVGTLAHIADWDMPQLGVLEHRRPGRRAVTACCKPLDRGLGPVAAPKSN